MLTGIGEVVVGRLNPCTAAHGTPEDKANRCGWVGVFVRGSGAGAGARGLPGEDIDFGGLGNVFVSASGPGAAAPGSPGKTKAGVGADGVRRGGCGEVDPVHCRAEDKANRCGWGGLFWVWVGVAGDEFLLGAIGLENAAADGADVAAVDMDGDGGGIGEGIADGVDIAAGG